MSADSPRVCVAANTTWYLYNFRAPLISRLIALGYRVTALSPSDRYVGGIRALGAEHVPLEMAGAGTNPFKEAAAIARIASRLRQLRPTVLVTYTPKVNIYCSLAARWLGIPMVATVSGLGYAFRKGNWLTPLARLLYRSALRHPAAVFFENEEDRAQLVSAGAVAAAKAHRVPGCGIDADRFRPAPRERPRSEFVFLLAARMLWDKGIGEFVEAARLVAAQVPSARFRLLGFVNAGHPSGVPQATLDQWTAEGIVTYLGETDDVVNYYATASCVVLPSYYQEGVPRTLLEAASMELPVIAADSTGCRDAVDHEVTGLLCRPRDAQDLAQAMLRILRLSPEERRRMGRAGRAKMLREFDEQAVIARYVAEIARIAPARAPAGDGLSTLTPPP